MPLSYLINDIVSAAGRVAGDVAQRPDGLLLHVLVRGPQELHEDGDGAGVDNNPKTGERKIFSQSFLLAKVIIIKMIEEELSTENILVINFDFPGLAGGAASDICQRPRRLELQRAAGITLLSKFR